jgi:hypothetical protein
MVGARPHGKEAKMDPDKVVEAVLKVSRAYLPERIVYIVGAGGGVFLLLYLAFTKLGQSWDPAVAAAIFGSGGLFASTAYGVLRAFDKTLQTIVQLLQAAPTPPAGPDAEG